MENLYVLERTTAQKGQKGLIYTSYNVRNAFEYVVYCGIYPKSLVFSGIHTRPFYTMP